MTDKQLFKKENIIATSVHQLTINNEVKNIIGSIYFRAVDKNEVFRGRLRLCHYDGPEIENNKVLGWKLGSIGVGQKVVLNCNLGKNNLANSKITKIIENSKLIINYEDVILENEGFEHTSRGQLVTQFNDSLSQQLIDEIRTAIYNYRIDKKTAICKGNLTIEEIMKNQTDSWGWQWYTDFISAF
jgi:hypothetical protein